MIEHDNMFIQYIGLRREGTAGRILKLFLAMDIIVCIHWSVLFTVKGSLIDENEVEFTIKT